MVSSSFGSGKCGRLSGLDGVIAEADESVRFGANVYMVSCWIDILRLGCTCIMLGLTSLFIGVCFVMALDA